MEGAGAALKRGDTVAIHHSGRLIGFAVLMERAEKRAPDDWYWSAISISPLVEIDSLGGVAIKYRGPYEVFNLGETEMQVVQ